MRTTRRDKIVDTASLLSLRAGYRQSGRTVVWTNGCFDLLHVGHVRSLHAASQLGDVLVVGINSDESVHLLKGEGRPILSQGERVEAIAALECVDHVVVFAEATPAEILGRLQPDGKCKGTDYAPRDGKAIPERAIVERHGGRVAFLPMIAGISTTELIRRIRELDGDD